MISIRSAMSFALPAPSFSSTKPAMEIYGSDHDVDIFRHAARVAVMPDGPTAGNDAKRINRVE